MQKRLGFLPAALALAMAGTAIPAIAHDETLPAASTEAAPGTWNGVGIEEHLGGVVPLDASFTGEDGQAVVLRDLVRVPTVLALVYYRCPNACDYMLTGMASVLAAVPAKAGEDYQVVTLSIDERETTVDALVAKRIGLESIQEPYPAEAWRFLTGNEREIHRVADAIGFHFVRNGEDFDHPLGLVVLSPQGKIVRYMTGTDFLPIDLKMSIMEASTGTVGPTIAKVLRVCFSYDPQSHRFVFRTLQVTATITLALAAGFVLYLILSGRRRRAARRV
jgi:protein SCO1/2